MCHLQKVCHFDLCFTLLRPLNIYHLRSISEIPKLCMIVRQKIKEDCLDTNIVLPQCLVGKRKEKIQKGKERMTLYMCQWNITWMREIASQ